MKVYMETDIEWVAGVVSFDLHSLRNCYLL